MTNKYRNQKVVTPHGTFDSRREYCGAGIYKPRVPLNAQTPPSAALHFD